MYCLEPIWADEMSDMCLEGGPGIFVVQRIPKTQHWPGTTFLGGELSNLCPSNRNISVTLDQDGLSPEELFRLHLVLASHLIIAAVNNCQGLIICQALC